MDNRQPNNLDHQRQRGGNRNNNGRHGRGRGQGQQSQNRSQNQSGQQLVPFQQPDQQGTDVSIITRAPLSQVLQHLNMTNQTVPMQQRPVTQPTPAPNPSQRVDFIAGSRRPRNRHRPARSNPVAERQGRATWPRDHIRCAECGKLGHPNVDCCSTCDDAGYIRTCVKCNPADQHTWDQCPVPTAPGQEQELCLEHRHGKPPVMMSKDIREIEGFNETTSRPMMSKFALRFKRNKGFAQYTQYAEHWQDDKPHEDRDWNNPASLPGIGQLCHPEMRAARAAHLRNQAANPTRTAANRQRNANRAVEGLDHSVHNPDNPRKRTANGPASNEPVISQTTLKKLKVGEVEENLRRMRASEEKASAAAVAVAEELAKAQARIAKVEELVPREKARIAAAEAEEAANATGLTMETSSNPLMQHRNPATDADVDGEPPESHRARSPSIASTHGPSPAKEIDQGLMALMGAAAFDDKQVVDMQDAPPPAPVHVDPAAVEAHQAMVAAAGPADIPALEDGELDESPRLTSENLRQVSDNSASDTFPRTSLARRRGSLGSGSDGEESNQNYPVPTREAGRGSKSGDSEPDVDSEQQAVTPAAQGNLVVQENRSSLLIGHPMNLRGDPRGPRADRGGNQLP